MVRRTTIEIDEDLLRRAQRALRRTTIRATVEEALRRAAAAVETEQRDRGARQKRYLEHLRTRAELDILASGEMWR
jgi:Arc/MetJ family transcription regulator